MLLRSGVDLVRVSNRLGSDTPTYPSPIVSTRELASLEDDSGDRLDAFLHEVSNKSATSTGTIDEKAAETAANSLSSLVERKGIEPSTSALRTRPPVVAATLAGT
jgi:hypothetical protein